MKSLLKALLASLGPEIAIEFLVQYLASTIKNRESEKAKKILSVVRRLRDACTFFLAHFGDPEERTLAVHQISAAGESFQDPRI